MTTIRKASLADLGQIMDIVADAQRFLRDSGVDQWQDNYPTAEIMACDIARGELYVAEQADERVVAIATISFAGEPTYQTIYDGEWPNNEPYAVIHRAAIRHGERCRGLAKQLFAFAEQLSAEQGVSNIRVDTHADNLVMQHLLDRCGYMRCGVITLCSGASRVAYIKQW